MSKFKVGDLVFTNGPVWGDDLGIEGIVEAIDSDDSDLDVYVRFSPDRASWASSTPGSNFAISHVKSLVNYDGPISCLQVTPNGHPVLSEEDKEDIANRVVRKLIDLSRSEDKGTAL